MLQKLGALLELIEKANIQINIVFTSIVKQH